MSYKVCALYKFAPCPDFEALRVDLLATTRQLGILGTLLIAPEGINGTIAGKPEAIESFVDYLQNDPIFNHRFTDAEIKYAPVEANPFVRMKVRLKREIVTLRSEKGNPQVRVGTYVNPSDWNAILDDPEMMVIDTRNTYETEEGIFQGAVDPKIRTFTAFKKWAEDNLDAQRDKKVAMYCTGGIRCEKASAYLLSEGFETVYHLKGGILAYMEQVPKEESKFEGGCFVFDARGVVDADALKAAEGS